MSVTWPRLFICWIPDGWDGFGSVRLAVAFIVARRSPGRIHFAVGVAPSARELPGQLENLTGQIQ
jgi:hypothetical protein